MNKHQQVKPNIAGLTSPVQQAEMKLILAGTWPQLKPLPVFRYETDEYRATIHFDKARGEWVCRKTSFPSNKVQEMRGGLTEITMTLPHAQVEVFSADAAAEQQEQELEKDANRRLQAILEWRANYESGARYSELQDYLSESQRDEIYDSIRLSLTARQLQFTPKNVAFVFDALLNAGGRLATLIEIAQQNKAQRGVDGHTQAHVAALDDSIVGSGAEISIGDFPHSLKTSFPSQCAKNFARDPINTSIPKLIEGLTAAPVESLIAATHETLPANPLESVFPEREQRSSPELIVRTASQASEIATPEILDASPLSFVEDLQQEAHHHTRAATFGPHVRTGKVELSGDRFKNSPSRLYVLEMSGFQVAALVILFAVITLAVGLTVGRAPLAKHFQDVQKSMPAVDAASPAIANRRGETISRTSISLAANTFKTPAVNAPAPKTEESRSESPPAQSLNRVRPTEPSSAVNGRSLVDAGNGVPRNPAPRRLTPLTRATPHPLPPSTILVTAPVHDGKPFRVFFPERPIAATSSFAMTSQLSVLVSPEPGLEVAPKPARVQAGELISFVWPRYPRPGDRYGSSETVKVRATIGQLGQVLDVKLVSGSISLLPAAVSAIRLWRYKPTLLNQSAVKAQQDVTIEFRPPRICRTCPASIHRTTSAGLR